MAMDLIETAPFQRLRRIRQLGPAFLTFHGAESSRFTHSLGVLHLARMALRQLETRDNELVQQRPLLYASALLHDVGHAPLSHSGEAMFGLRHETWSARLVREHADLRDRLEATSAGLAEAVANLLENGSTQHAAIGALVSGQLDCDRLDYLLRDSYSTGTCFGQLDLERILASLTLAPDGSLALHPKGLPAIEHYLVVRQLMYRSVYNHRLNGVCNWLLQHTIQVARRLGPDRVWADPTMARWLWDPKGLDVESYLANDDIVTGYHLERWRRQGPPELVEPCARLLDRRLLKAMDVSELNSPERLELLAEARRLAVAAGMAPDGCCGLQQRQSRGYHPYKGGLRLWDGLRLQALEQRSELVKVLCRSEEMAWLIHPPALSASLATLMRERTAT